jgi:hypothetical protein
MPDKLSDFLDPDLSQRPRAEQGEFELPSLKILPFGSQAYEANAREVLRRLALAEADAGPGSVDDIARSLVRRAFSGAFPIPEALLAHFIAYNFPRRLSAFMRAMQETGVRRVKVPWPDPVSSPRRAILIKTQEPEVGHG